MDTALLKVKNNGVWEEVNALRGKEGSVIASTTLDSVLTSGNYKYKQTYTNGDVQYFEAPCGPASSYYTLATIPVNGWDATTKQATFNAPGYDDTTMAGFPMPVAASSNEWRRCQILAKSVSGTTITLECAIIPTQSIDLVFNVITIKKP